MSVKLYWRKDLEQWAITTVGDLRRCLAELPDDLELHPNGLGNLSVWEVEGPPKRADHMRYYIGYIDLALGQVFLKPGNRPPSKAPGHDTQSWIGNQGTEVEYVTRSDHETNQP